MSWSVAGVVVGLNPSEEVQVQSPIAQEQGVGSAVGDVSDAIRQILLDDAGHLPVAGGIIAQSAVNRPIVEKTGELEGHHLRGAARRTEEKRVGRAHGNANAVVIVGRLPAAPRRLPLDIREDLEAPARLLLRPDRGNAIDVGGGRPPLPAAGREVAERAMVRVKGQRELLEIVLTLCPVRRFAHLLHRRHQKRDQRADDGNHHEQLNQCERRAAMAYHFMSPPLAMHDSC